MSNFKMENNVLHLHSKMEYATSGRVKSLKVMVIQIMNVKCMEKVKAMLIAIVVRYLTYLVL